VFALLDINTSLYYLDAEIGFIIAPVKWKGLVPLRGAAIFGIIGEILDANSRNTFTFRDFVSKECSVSNCPFGEGISIHTKSFHQFSKNKL
jgi:hypothetical protein